jgi:hypothetical protein
MNAKQYRTATVAADLKAQGQTLADHTTARRNERNERNGRIAELNATVQMEIAGKLAACIASSDAMDRIASSRFDNAIAKGKGYGPNAFNYVEGYSIGSADVPSLVSNERETSASVERRDAGTEYAAHVQPFATVGENHGSVLRPYPL